MLFKEGSRVRNSDNVYRLITVCWALRRKRGDESHVPLSSRQAWDSKRNIGISWTWLEDDPGSVPQRRCPTRTNLALVKLRGLIISIQITNGEICQHEEHLKWGQKVAQDEWLSNLQKLNEPEAMIYWGIKSNVIRHSITCLMVRVLSVMHKEARALCFIQIIIRNECEHSNASGFSPISPRTFILEGNIKIK